MPNLFSKFFIFFKTTRNLVNKSAETDRTPIVPIFSYVKSFFQHTMLLDTEIAILTEKNATITNEKALHAIGKRLD